MALEFIGIEIRETDGPVASRILEEVAKLHWAIHQLREETNAMSSTAVTRDQFDAALAKLLQAEAARDAAVTKALNDLLAKVNAGTVTPADFSAELASITTLQTNAAALTQTATADDPGPTTVPTTPATPAPAPSGS